MLKKPIGIGIENYKELIDKSCYFVDKTLMIKDLLDYRVKVGLFTRPRRFRKTLTLSMIKTLKSAKQLSRQKTHKTNLSMYLSYENTPLSMMPLPLHYVALLTKTNPIFFQFLIVLFHIHIWVLPQLSFSLPNLYDMDIPSNNYLRL